MRFKIQALILLFAITAIPAYADYKITQKTIVEDMTTESTVWVKGVRQRNENKMMIDDADADTAAMMENMMPNLVTISQCDLKQDVSINEKKKSYFIDYYDWSGLSPEQRKRPNVEKTTIKGTFTISSTVTDLGKQKEMFGLTARYLKHVQIMDSSADSCEGARNFRIERTGWFVNLSLESNTCERPKIPNATGGCRPKIVIKSSQQPGFFLEGETLMFENNKLEGKNNLVTTALSKATLDQALFEIPKDFTEVDSLSELMQPANIFEGPSATTVVTGSAGSKGKALKTVAIDFFSGNTSKIDEDSLRQYISSKLTNEGMSGFPINSQSDIQTGNFANVIGVQIKKIKESGGAKIGGLFGKVTGNTDAAKLGETEAEIVITIYSNDGKNVVNSASATEKIKGSPDDAVKAAIDKILSGLLKSIK